MADIDIMSYYYADITSRVDILKTLMLQLSERLYLQFS